MTDSKTDQTLPSVYPHLDRRSTCRHLLQLQTSPKVMGFDEVEAAMRVGLDDSWLKSRHGPK